MVSALVVPAMMVHGLSNISSLFATQLNLPGRATLAKAGICIVCKQASRYFYLLA